MKIYPDLWVRRAIHVGSDLFVIAWVVLWACAGVLVQRATWALAGPGERLQAAGTSFTNTMSGAAGQVDDLPIVGNAVAVPFQEAARAGVSISDSGRSLVTAVHHLATILGWTTALTPIVPVVLIWAFLRLRFIRRASAAQRLIDSDGDLDLFALRAMAHQPLTALAKISSDPTGDWRRYDPQVVHALACLELRSVGLHPPRPEVPGGARITSG